MDKKEFLIKIKHFFKLEDMEEFSNKIDTYVTFLREQNKIHNLTRLSEEDKIYSQYFFQSVIPYKQIDFRKIKKMLDIGSGSGIPGIVIKIMFPHIELTIIESNFKKANFMRQLCEKLELNNIIISIQRAEEIKGEQKETFDFVTSRAVANTEIILEISIAYLKVDGLLVLPKSSNYLSEVKNLDLILKRIKAKLLNIDNFNLEGYNHVVLTIQKISKTPNIYPRKWTSIIKGFDYGKN